MLVLIATASPPPPPPPPPDLPGEGLACIPARNDTALLGVLSAVREARVGLLGRRAVLGRADAQGHHYEDGRAHQGAIPIGQASKWEYWSSPRLHVNKGNPSRPF